MVSPIYLYDGSFEGLLTAVARAVKSQTEISGIYSVNHYTPKLFDEPVHIPADSEQAQRLFDYLQQLKGQAARLTMDGFLSEDLNVGIHLYRMVLTCLQHGSKATQVYTNDSIRYLDTLSRKVSFEAHRLTGLIRFRILENELQYAPFEPDHLVIGHLARHFQHRLSGRKWILHDIRRNIGLYWDCKDIQSIAIDRDFTTHVQQYGDIPDTLKTDEEQHYQHLWKSFHHTITIADKTNPALQRQFMPKRYWKYLVEM